MPYVALAREEGRNFGKATIGMINGLSVRTKRIDDELEKNNLTQICVFGAGLDTRPWRIKKPSSVADPIHYFEVDFPEVFAFKLATLHDAGAVSEYEYSVGTDLSVSGWSQVLIDSGFNPNIPTFFILEGFVNYLTVDEVTAFFNILSKT